MGYSGAEGDELQQVGLGEIIPLYVNIATTLLEQVGAIILLYVNANHFQVSVQHQIPLVKSFTILIFRRAQPSSQDEPIRLYNNTCSTGQTPLNTKLWGPVLLRDKSCQTFLKSTKSLAAEIYYLTVPNIKTWTYSR